MDKIKTLLALLKRSTLDWLDREIKANSNHIKETTWKKVCERLIEKFESK